MPPPRLDRADAHPPSVTMRLRRSVFLASRVEPRSRRIAEPPINATRTASDPGGDGTDPRLPDPGPGEDAGDLRPGAGRLRSWASRSLIRRVLGVGRTIALAETGRLDADSTR